MLGIYVRAVTMEFITGLSYTLHSCPIYKMFGKLNKLSIP